MFLNNPEDFITNLNDIASKKIQLYIDKLIIYTRIYRRYYALGVNMMQIARLRVAEESEKGETGKGIAQNEIVWDYIVDNYNSWDNEDVKPLYLTQRDIYKDISLIVSSKSTDAFAEFILDNLTKVDVIEDIWMFNLMEPRFFTVPENLSQNIKRYTIALNVLPKEAINVYERLSKIKPSPDLLITYITYTYHKRSNVLISLLAGNRDSVAGFITEYIDGIKGVARSEIIPIKRSRNLATPKEWKDHCGKYFIAQDTNENEDLKIYENWSKLGFE